MSAEDRVLVLIWVVASVALSTAFVAAGILRVVSAAT
jgi:hypothetical protein